MNLKRVVLGVIVLSILITPSAYAWCFLGIGNTCGDRVTEPHSTIGKYFNWDEPQEDNNDISIFGLRPFKKSPFAKSDDTNNFKDMDEGDTKTATSDSGKSYSMKNTNKRSEIVSEYEARWFDVDVTDISIRCPSCISLEGKPFYSAGFAYLVDVTLQNSGNTPSEKVQLEVTVETPDQVEHYNFNENALTLGTGEYQLQGLIFPKFGIENNQLKDQYIYTGLGARTFPMVITAKLTYSNGVTSPRIQVIEHVDRKCSGKGNATTCKDVTTYEKKETCPDGRNYNGIYSCNLKDPDTENNFILAYPLQKVTTDLNSRMRINIGGLS